MKYNKLFYLLFIKILLVSCTVSPQKVEYGKDACSFCKMTIVETKFAAEIVTNKGRAFKYDAVECMINALAEKKENTLKYILVTDYTKPKELIDATTATYLINKEIKSPMGANLSAYTTLELAGLNGTQLFNWSEIKARFKN